MALPLSIRSSQFGNDLFVVRHIQMSTVDPSSLFSTFGFFLPLSSSSPSFYSSRSSPQNQRKRLLTHIRHIFRKHFLIDVLSHRADLLHRILLLLLLEVRRRFDLLSIGCEFATCLSRTVRNAESRACSCFQFEIIYVSLRGERHLFLHIVSNGEQTAFLLAELLAMRILKREYVGDRLVIDEVCDIFEAVDKLAGERVV